MRAVEKEYKLVGMSDGLCGDYAAEVARRVVSSREKEIAEEVNKILPKDWVDKSKEAKNEGDMYTGGFFMGMFDTVEKVLQILNHK